MRTLRSLAALLIVGSLTFTVGSTDALAKKKKTATADMVNIELTNIAEADSKVFQPAMDLHNSLNDIETTLAQGNTALDSALGIAEGTPFADAMADLKTQAGSALKVEMDGMTPKVSLDTSVSVPENVQNAVTSLQGFMDAHIAALDKTKDLPAQAQALVTAAASLDPSALAQQAGANVLEAAKILKTLTSNLSAIKTTPERVTNVIGKLTADLDAVKGLAN
ncbi:MAG: hypothetical protein GXP62_18185 [Oligoflexia bacterium]|nr:hypothetical protein [Oligoflexia bacterium]